MLWEIFGVKVCGEGWQSGDTSTVSSSVICVFRNCCWLHQVEKGEMGGARRAQSGKEINGRKVTIHKS